MTRTLCSLLAAGVAVLAGASPARAEARFQPRHEPRAIRASAWEHRHEREWSELERARRRFYLRWSGNPVERARFERWYAHRCEELRRW